MSRHEIPVETPAPTTCMEAEPFALRVTDASMEPEFARGCVIVVDPTGVARDGAWVIAEHGDGFLLRRLRLAPGRAWLEALDPAFPDVELARGLAGVRGVVVQRAGIRRRDHKRYA